MRLKRSLLALAAVGILVVTATAAQGSASTGSTDPFAGATITELSKPTPDWYTDQLHAKAVAAAKQGEGVAIPDGVDYPTSGIAFTGIRPGAWMLFPAGCTMNFVFSKGGVLGIGTAGHCTDNKGQHVILLTLAPGTNNPVLVDIGTVVARHDNGIGDDFALVSIDPVLYPWVSPTTAVIGGPCGAYTGSGPETVAHYGHGLVIGTGGTPRAGVALTWRTTAFGWDGAAIFGDSGSPVRVTGLEAAGDLTHLVVDTRWLPSFIAGTRIGKMLQIASGWSLVDSSLCLP